MKITNAIKEGVRGLVKGIGSGWQTTNVPVPQNEQFLHFMSIANAEDGPSFIRISDPYIDNSWVYASIAVMSSNLAQAPFTLYNGDTPIESTSGIYSRLWRLFNNVSPYMNRYALIESIIIWLSIRGECFWRLVRNTLNGESVRIEIMIPENMYEVVKNGEIIGWKYHHPNNNIEPIEPEDIIQFKYYNPYNKFRGMSPLTAAMLGVHIDYSAAAYNYYFFNNSASPHLILSTEADLNDEESKAVLNRFNAKHKGLKRSGASALLTRGAKAQVVAMAQKDIEYINQRKWSRDEVFAVLGVPPALAQILEHASIKSNIKEQKKQLFENNLIPKAAMIEDTLRTEFFEREKFKGLSAKFDFSEVDALQEDMDKKVERAERLAKIGFTRNEINEKLELGFEDQPWGNSWWVPMGIVPVNDDGASVVTASQPPVVEAPKKAIEAPIPQIEYKKPPTEAERARMDGERIERAYGKRISEYFYKIRKEVLAKVYAKEGYKGTLVKQIDPSGLGYDLLFDISLANLELYDLSIFYLEEAYAAGIAQLEYLNAPLDITQTIAKDAIQARAKTLAEINETLARQLQDNFAPILERGLEQGLSYETVAQELAEATRGIMNSARSRAMTIAVTEINGAMNEGRFGSMLAAGTKRHKWITAHDSRVRESHFMLDEKDVRVGEEFAWGLRYPGDIGAPAGEVINCRCVTIPYYEEAPI